MNYKGIAIAVKEPKATRNLFGDISEIAGRPMLVLDRSEEGDCLCLEPRGKYLVDVDHTDIEKFVPSQPNPFVINL